MFRYEILNDIDNIESVNVYTECCVMNEICSMYDKRNELADYVQEGVLFGEGSIFSKLVSIIKSFFSVIRSWISRIISKITGKIRSGRDTINGVIMKALKSKEKNKPEKTEYWVVPKPDGGVQYQRYVTESFKEKVSSQDKSIRVEIPAGKESVFTSALVDIPTDDVVCAFDDETKSLRFKIFGAGKLSTVTVTNDKSGETPMNIPKTKNPVSGSAKTALYLITNPNEFARITQLVDLAMAVISNKDKNAENMLNHDCSKVINSIFKNAEKLNDTECVVSMKNITEFQKMLNEQSIKMDKFVNIEKTDVSSYDKKTVKVLNELTTKLIRIQISMNMLSSALEERSIVNGNFIGSIKSVAILDIFVKRCIDNGIPPKYIGFNTWLVADESIRGKADTFKPVWGQTRVIFFPPSKDIVYKIALSGAGISSNEAEVRTSQLFVEMNRVDLIAPVVKAWGNGAVVALERIPNNGKKPTYDILLKYTKDVNDVIKRYEEKKGVKINTKITDQHRDNVMFDDRIGCYRSIDYGIAKRSY